VTQNRQDGGVNILGQVSVGDDLVGRDKITINQYQVSTAGSVAVAPHHLPPPPRDFTGRTAELADLLSAVEKNGVTISGVQGLGGVGKTALALKLAERLTPSYPEAQFYIDLKGGSDKPVEAKDAMGYVIRACLTDLTLPANEAELRGLYQSVLHGKRAILVMDNAQDETQVEPLIPPPTCLFLVTSRRHFTLPGLLAKNLDSLTPGDARNLMIGIAPRLAKEQSDYAGDLARLCGYLPLAIRSVASVLAARVDLNPADYVRRLTHARERLKLTATDASLRLSYDLLTAELQNRFAALGVFPDTFDVSAAEAVWESEHDSAQDSLSDLCQYSLVEYSPSDRYRLHDLVRLFADAHIVESQRQTIQRRHAAHYKDVASNADTLYLQGGDHFTKGLALFDIEWANIQAGQAWAAAHADEDNIIRRLCCDYATATNYCSDLRQPARNRIQWLQKALLAARELSDREAEGIQLGSLGRAWYALGDFLKAIEYHEQQLQIAWELLDRRAEGRAMGSLGLAYHALREFKRSINFYNRQLKIAREIGDRQGEGIALNNLGIDSHSLGDYGRAIDCHEQCLQIARETGDLRGQGIALGNLGSDYYAQGDYQRAVDYLQQNLQVAREIGDRRGEEMVEGNLGFAYYRLGDYRRAIDCQERCLALARESKRRRSQGKALWNMSMALHELGETARAFTCAETALQLFEGLEDAYARRISENLARWREDDEPRSAYQ
jgi:tetratricopeptide (TPR) repeat protein